MQNKAHAERRSAIASGACGLALVALLLLSSAPASAVLLNADFETGSLGPWYQDYFDPINPPTAYSWTVTNTTAYAGTYSATTAGNNRVRQDFSPIPMEEITGINFRALAPPPKPNHSALFGAYLFFSDRFLIFQTFSMYSNDWLEYDLLAALDYSPTCNPATSGLCVAGTHVNGIGFIGSVAEFAQVLFVDAVIIERAVPEPATLALFGVGLAGLGALYAISRAGRTIREGL